MPKRPRTSVRSIKVWSMRGDTLLLYLFSTVTMVVKEKMLMVKKTPEIFERKSVDTSTGKSN